MTVGSPKPHMAVTMGDPAGVGPEVVLKACFPTIGGDLPTWTWWVTGAGWSKLARPVGP